MWWRPPFHLRTVIVSLKSDDDSALRGVAWQTRRQWIVLRNVELIRPNSAPVKMDGEAVIPRENVAFLQLV